jgi:uncharacterized protein (TIGR02246 family)
MTLSLSKCLITLFAVTGVFALLPSALSTPMGDTQADAKALTKVDEDWSKSVATRDAEKVVSFYAEDAIGYPPNEPVAVGRPAIKKIWTAMLADASFSISWKPVHVEVATSGDLGYTTGTYEDSAKGPDGKTVTDKGKYVSVWKKQKDGTWKSIHDMWSSDAK